MKKLQVLMPMAGAGSRFAQAGFTTPKPLIPVDGMPMFQKTLDSLRGITAAKEFTFVIRQEHVDRQNLAALIKEALPEAHIAVIPEMTRGAAETALIGVKELDRADGLVVMDCDLWFQGARYDQLVMDALSNKSETAGVLPTFTAHDPRYSYVKTDSEGRVLQTAEKKVISSQAIIGSYFFARAGDFVEAAEELLAQPLTDTLPEYYLSPLYNIIIKGGGTVMAAPVDEYHSFGTPEELEAYEKISQR